MTTPKGKKISHHRGGHYGNSYILFDSLKNNCIIECESELEHSMFVSFEADPKVLSYVPHPGEIIIANSNNENSKTLFDAYVKYVNGYEEYIECKYAAELNDLSSAGDRSRRQKKLHQEWCRAHGYNYRVITDEELYESHYRFSNNLYLVHKNRFIRGDENYRKYVHSKSRLLLKKIEQLGNSTIEELCKFEMADEVLDQILYLAYLGEIAIDMDSMSICNATRVIAL